MKNLFLLTLLSFILLSACRKDQLTANGDILTEIRTPGEFTTLHISGANRVKVSYGPGFMVELKGSSNLMRYYKTDLVNKHLYLGYKNAGIMHDDMEIFITLPLLHGVSLSGSANIAIEGDYPDMDELNLVISGSGDISLNQELHVMQLNAGISGSGKLFLQKALIREADVDISGSGDIHLQVHDRLKVRISGSGDVYYQGNPFIDSKISGSGKLIRF
ncbi:putative auto-transporter adhesin, head GIN domain [compost metagenome]